MLKNGYYLTHIRYTRGDKIIEYFSVDVHNRRVYYTKYEELDDGYAKVMKNGKWGILTPQGTIWGSLEFTSIASTFSEDMIRVSKNGKFGYADKATGRFIGCIFDSAENFNGGKANVLYKGRKCVINTCGKIING